MSIEFETRKSKKPKPFTKPMSISTVHERSLSPDVSVRIRPQKRKTSSPTNDNVAIQPSIPTLYGKVSQDDHALINTPKSSGESISPSSFKTANDDTTTDPNDDIDGYF